MKKVYIPDHRGISGANIWIYEGYRKAWESLGYSTEYYNSNSKKLIESSGGLKDYYVMATDWFYEPFHNSDFILKAKKVFLFPQPTVFPKPWGLHPNFISSLTPKIISEINEQENTKLWS